MKPRNIIILVIILVGILINPISAISQSIGGDEPENPGAAPGLGDYGTPTYIENTGNTDSTTEVIVCSPDTSGQVTTITGYPIEGVWVWWKDNNNNVRYAQTQGNGYYYFSSWRGMNDQARINQTNTPVDTNLDGNADAKIASTTNVNSFSCGQNPHTVTAIKAYNWSGSFSTVSSSFNNNSQSAEFPTIIYTPAPNSASCIPDTGNAIEAPSSVTVGQTFQVTVRMRNSSEFTTWTSQNNYRLGRWDNNGWVFPDGNKDRVYLQSSVNGGDTVTFTNFNVTAPNSAGNKTLTVRMVQDGREWFGEICSKSITVNGVVTTLPSIQGINVINGGGSGNAIRTSGSKTDQQGTGYNNPLTITLNATAGKNGNINVPSTFYVVFYKQSTGLISSDFINSATNRLADPTNGVLLAYDQTNNRCGGSHCVFDPIKDQWVNINSEFYRDQGYQVGTLMLVFPGAEKQWKVTFDRSFGTKSMYTSAYVFDSNGKSAFIGGDIPPNTQ